MLDRIVESVWLVTMLTLCVIVFIWPRRRRAFVPPAEGGALGYTVSLQGARMPDGARRSVYGTLMIDTGDAETNRLLRELYRDIEPTIAAVLNTEIYLDEVRASDPPGH
jgi:hypothetical protein